MEKSIVFPQYEESL